MVIRTHKSIITLNVNGLNAPIRRQRVAEWIQKQGLYIYCLQETHFRSKDTHILKVRGWKNVFCANGNQKKARVSILISDKIHFETETVIRDKEGHYIMIKGLTKEEDITIVYIPNTGAPKYIKQILTDIKGKTDSNTIIVEDFNTVLTSVDRSS